LGVQMNMHSTLNSFLNRLVWLLTGHYGRPGTNNAFVPILNLSSSTRETAAKGGKDNGNSKARVRPDRSQPGHGRQGHHGLDPLQCDPRGNPY
jgi:hypothetical protein